MSHATSSAASRSFSIVASSNASSFVIGRRSIVPTMKPASPLFVLCLCVVACGGSTATTTSSTSSRTSPESKRSAPVIAALKTHDGKVSIVGAGKELRIHVAKDDGTVIADDATLDELRTKDPETWMLVKSSVAQSDGTFLDATFVEAPTPTLK